MEDKRLFSNNRYSPPPTSLTQFADELLEYIFCLPILDFKDIINLSQSCQRLFSLSQSNEIWRCKLILRWKANFHFHQNDEDNLKNVFKETLALEMCLIERLSELANTAYGYDEVPYSFLRELKDLYSSDNDKLNTILDILYMFIDVQEETGDINRKYFARKVYKYLYHDNLKKLWIDLLDSPIDNALQLEKGAIMLAQWCNPELRITFESISEQLDVISNSVKEILPDKLISSQKVTYDEAVSITKAMNKVLFENIGFRGNMNSYYDIENSFINRVLERKLGIPISLAILYISVARRLGLNMQGVNFPGHFLICIMFERRNGSPLYIDPLNKGTLLNEDQCIEQFVSSIDRFNWPREMMFQIAGKRKLFIRMVTNVIHVLKESAALNSQKLPLLCTAHELMHIFDPNNEENTLLLSRIHLHQGINLEDVASRFQEMFSSHGVQSYSILLDALNAAKSRKEPKVISPKYRSHPENQKVEFHVGTILEHERFSYRCVIYGWDSVCYMDDEWQAQMGVHRLQDKDQQPFYHVLADDGSSRYAAQESLRSATTFTPISNSDVGKYFKSFKETQYVFTDKLSEAYPEDEIVHES